MNCQVVCLAAVGWQVNDKGVGLTLVISQVTSDKLTRESLSRVAPPGSKLLLRNLRVLNLGCQGKEGKHENLADLQGQAQRW